MNYSILIMAGGTGGHIFPALAVADILRAQGWQVAWLGAPRSMEAELVPKHGYTMLPINFSGVRGKGWLRRAVMPFDLVAALWQSARAIFKLRPDVVLGMGGYITVPGGLIAAFLRRPLIIHEQNSVAGLSNRVLAHIAQRVMSGFPNVLPKAIWCGNPVRSSIAGLADPQQRYAARQGKLNILVVGGSLGAKAINEIMPYAIALLPTESRPQLIHQTGKKHFESVNQLYRQVGVQAEVKPFLDDMAHYYASADLVICRAGALTIAELAAAGVASILIPFPFAVDDHQTSNARFLSSRGAAWLIPQSDFSAEKLAQLLSEVSREKLSAMAQQARGLAQTDAAVALANACEELAR
ncbi:MAG TPA: undecaprenyldiphospho-muramoylpentapeptide beta-N-acetylglucosaminyltransferase [Gallionella sp.]|nr:undecaprenyldiphospho-muramoylpentapeptide beta-N-acetylglucosaminyltransferase [Gallionella sp.]